MTEFDGQEDQFDENGEILVILHNDSVIGGARTVSSAPYARKLLPLEDGFHLIDLLPEWNLASRKYCEFSRLAIDPAHRTPDILNGLVAALIWRAIANHNDYLFTNTPLTQARCYRKIVNMLGYQYEILNHIPMPVQSVYTHLRGVCLSMIDFGKPYVRNQAPPLSLVRTSQA